MSAKNLVKISFLFILMFSGCAKTKTKVIEINTVPFPFNVNETQPYVVWANGRRVDMPQKEIIHLVSRIGRENIKAADSSDIHRGWLYSYFKGDVNEFKAGRKR